VFPEPTIVPPLLLTHVMLGAGLPLALQKNSAVSFSITVWFLGFVTKLGRTTTEKKNLKILEAH